ncbi:K02A2.6-like [Cordylochernes scorpioides]|uniref:K02A2.6-like n=1 Tax=Cordylochernes scorpioides TaxID=51811 RepID=A0ABY6K5I2_9ARAC|nr:K02A2.6-like [Cordylochernes scorpioides]
MKGSHAKSIATLPRRALQVYSNKYILTATAEPAGLIRRIVREDIQKVFLGPVVVNPLRKMNALEQIVREEVSRALDPMRPQINVVQNNFARPINLDRPTQPRKREQWRTYDDKPICFHCGRPRQIVRYWLTEIQRLQLVSCHDEFIDIFDFGGTLIKPTRTMKHKINTGDHSPIKHSVDSNYLFTVDLRSGYWQIEVDEKDREKTASITPIGLYELRIYNGLPSPDQRLDCKKLLKRCFGPYKVTKKLSEVTYEVESVDPSPRSRKFKDIVHVIRMKPYLDPEEQHSIF